MTIIQKGLRCPTCKEEIYSNFVHDFVACTCDAIFVDGGFDYFRYGWTDILPEEITRTLDEYPKRYFRNENS